MMTASHDTTSLQVTISKDDTILLDGAGDKSAIEERCAQIQETIKSSTSDYDKHAPDCLMHCQPRRSWILCTRRTAPNHTWPLLTSSAATAALAALERVALLWTSQLPCQLGFWHAVLKMQPGSGS